MKRLLFVLLAFLFPIVVFAQRLPRIAFPEHYDLTFTPHLTAETFEGSEIISISVQRPTREIVLNALEINLRNVSIESQSRRQQASVTLDAEREMATLKTSELIEPGPALIHIEYTGKLNRDLRGFYIGSTRSGTRMKYAASQGEATDIRRAFPSFDEPAFKATFSITIIADKTDSAISNGATASDTPGPGPNQHTIRFETTPRLSSYLVALAVGNFHCVQGEADRVPLGICGLGDQSALSNFALQSTKEIIPFYDNYYGIHYPFGKLDQIGIPDFAAGAMENAGAIIYRESALFADPKSASLTRRKGIASTIAHEIAHMWFGDLVTMNWWNDIWLNEGFATWMSSKPLKIVHPEWRFDLEEINEISEAMNTDVLSNTRAIRANAETSREIDALFDAIAYQKTASLLRMIESYVGEDNFRAGVTRYLQNYSYGNSESYDFFEALASISNSSADKVADSFVNQAGVPVVSVTSSCDKNETVLQLRQKRFLLNGDHHENSQSWNVPICQKNTCKILNAPDQTLRFPGCSGITFLNQGGTGYFVTEYNPDSEAQIIQQAKTLNEQERMAFSRDEWYLVQTGAKPIGSFLQFAKSLRDDATPQYLESVLKNLQFISDFVATPADEAAFRNWTSMFLQETFRVVGTRPKTGESEEMRVMRGELWKALAVTAKDADAIRNVRKMADEYLRDRNSIDPNIATSIVEAAAANGDARLYDQIVEAYRAGGTPEENRRFLYVLADFRDPVLLQRTMAFALSNDVRNQDTGRLMAAVIRNPMGGKIGWNFLKQHWTEVTKKLSDALQLALVSATGGLCDPAQRDEVKSFFAEHSVPGSDRNLAQALEKISICNQTKSAQQSNLANWLK